MTKKILIRSLSSAVATAVVLGCGSGINKNKTESPSLGGGGSVAPNPTPTPTPVVTAPDVTGMNSSVVFNGMKTLRFTWADTADETSYKILQSVSGQAGDYTAVATVAADVVSYDWQLDQFLGAIGNAKYKLQACNSGGCTDTAELSRPTIPLSAIGYFKASNTNSNDFFGFSVALSKDGNTMAVGARFEDGGATGINGDQSDNTKVNAGAVYIFTKGSGGWSQQAYIKASNTDAGDWYAHVVSLSDDGNTLAVSAIYEQSTSTGINADETNNSGSEVGAVYVYVRSGSTWTQEAYIKASNAQSSDLFGASLDLSSDGNTLAVGASNESSSATGVNGNESSNAASYSGAVYIYTRASSVWTKQAYLKASNTTDRDYFGTSVSLSSNGNTLAVGANREASSATGIDGDQTLVDADGAGAVFVFTRSGVTWSQQAYVKASNTAAGDVFGERLALSADGNTMVVSARNEASSATGINGNQASDGTSGSGAVYVFIRTGSTWTQQAYIKAAVAQVNLAFGTAVAISHNGNTIAVTAGQDGSAGTGVNSGIYSGSVGRSGSVYTFTRSAGVWSSQSYLKATNPGTNDQFGFSLAFSDVGLAIGARDEQSAATGIGGNAADNTANQARYKKNKARIYEFI